MSGAGSNFRTELGAMQTAAQHVFDVNAQIQSQLSSLQSRLDPLMGTWQGSAATSFQVLKERWHQDAPSSTPPCGRLAKAWSRSTATTRRPRRTASRALPRSRASLEAEMSGDGHIQVTFGAVNEAAMDTDAVASQIAQQLSDLKAPGA